MTSHLLCWTENPFQLGETLFSLRVDPIQKEGKIENGRVASHERILIHLKDTEGWETSFLLEILQSLLM